MSVQDEILVAGSDSFWEVDGYKNTIKRTEDGMQMCGELMKLIQERAEIEKDYAKRLKSWSKKWTDSFEKGCEYGTNKSTLKGCVNEADLLADIHLTVKDRLMSEVHAEVKEWKNENYKKNIVGGCREAKNFEDEFKKMQKPWAKKLSKMVKCRKDYHSACKLERTALSHENNANSDTSADQQKKHQEKAEKCKREVETAKGRYEDSLSELNEYTAKYIEDMTDVYERTQSFEEMRLNFFKQVLYKLHSSLDLTSNQALSQIYGNFRQTIDQSDPSKDLKWWSQFRGVDMMMTWPEFQEYSPDGQALPRKEKAKGGYAGSNDGLPAGAKNNGTPPMKYNQSGNDLSDQGGDNPFGDEEWDEYYNVATVHEDDDIKGGGVSVTVRALYDYLGQDGDELSFKAGDLFEKLRDRDDQGWCTGRKDGRNGLYPDNYVELV